MIAGSPRWILAAAAAALLSASAPAQAESGPTPPPQPGAEAAPKAGPQRSLYVQVAPLRPSGGRWDAFDLMGLHTRIRGLSLAAEAPDPVACVLHLDGSGVVVCDPAGLAAAPPCLDRFACEHHDLPLDVGPERPAFGLIVFDWEPVTGRSTGLFDFWGQWTELRAAYDSVDVIATAIVSAELLTPKSPEWRAATERMAFLVKALVRPKTREAALRLGPPYQNFTAAEMRAGVETTSARLTIRTFD